MKNNYLIVVLAFILFFTSNIYAQKVGLVLSGGGAKGMAHIGVIQALEDNNIPIDYVAGTSIGAIVGGMYAMGYTPKEMLDLFKSREFAYWQTGEVQENYVYSYKRKDPAPDFFSVKFSIKDSLIIHPRYLPASLVNPVQMNIAFLSLFAQATAVSGGNFDSLYVPFRCVASDVYHKKPVVMRSGDLGEAVRASMTFPFVFKPIEIDSVLLYDGGMYDNFPVRTMKKDFNPDYLIGASVANNPRKPNLLDLMSQMENMVMQHTDYSIKEKEGTMIRFQFDDVKLLDFYRAEELYIIGYKTTLEYIDQIKKRVPREITEEELQKKRATFRGKFPELRFQNIKVTGVDEAQQLYVLKSFKQDRGFITMDELQQSYFKLVSDNRISEIYPEAVYNHETGFFDLTLDVTLDDNFVFSVGGNISSSVSSQAYFALNYQLLKAVGLDFDLRAQFGKSYNALQLASQIDFPSLKFPFNIRLIGNIQGFNYYEGSDTFFQEDESVYSEKNERYVKLELGFPISTGWKMSVGTGYGYLSDYYYQSPDDFTQENRDESDYSLVKFYGNLAINTLNDKQYPNKGSYCDMTGELVTGNEWYNSSTNSSENTKTNSIWWQVQSEYQKYYAINKHFTVGIQANAVWSERPLCSNYTATILQAPAFTPTPHSKYTFNEAFVANQFGAAGVKPIYNITRQLSLRSEFYLFVPVFPIEKLGYSGVEYGKSFSRFEYLAEASVVFRLPFIAVSVFGNYYSSPSADWNVGFNIGYLIYNKKFLD